VVINEEKESDVAKPSKQDKPNLDHVN